MRRQLVSLIILSLWLPGIASYPTVAYLTQCQLVTWSDVIVVARVDEIEKWQGHTIAHATVTEIVKGPTDLRSIYFVAQPTWACDTSTAIRGEMILGFFQGRHSEMFEWPKDLQSLPDNPEKPLFLIAWSGMGRMPISERNGERYIRSIYEHNDEILLGRMIEQVRTLIREHCKPWPKQPQTE